MIFSNIKMRELNSSPVIVIVVEKSEEFVSNLPKNDKNLYILGSKLLVGNEFKIISSNIKIV